MSAWEAEALRFHIMTDTQPLTSLNATLTGTPNDLPEILDWMHLECERRANRQYDVMVPFMGFNAVTKTYDDVDTEEFRSHAYKAAVAEVKRLYRNDLVSPEGDSVPMTDDLVAWMDEYWLQRSYFVSNHAREEAKRQTAAHFGDGKRFTMGRFLAMQADLAAKMKLEKSVGLS